MRKVLLLIIVSIVAFGAIFAGWILAWWKRWQQQQRIAKLAALRAQHERLSRVVNHLLEKANEVDQEILYLGASLPVKETGRLAQACTNLVTLSESLPSIEELLEREELKKGRDAILTSCRIAVSISNDISFVEQSAVRLSGCKQTV
jgi:hypothetical protein